MAAGEVPARGNIIPCIPARYILAVLSSIGMAIIYGLKVNLSVAMVAMTNHTGVSLLKASEHHDDHNFGMANITREECEADLPKNGSAGGNQDGPFIYDTNAQGIILSCYFWGYLLSQIPGAFIAQKLSAKWVMWFSVFINVICTLLTPPAAHLGVWAVVLMRVLEGIGGGVTFPAEHTLIASWAPPTERSTISSIIYAGTALGTVISMLMAGMLAEYFGWASIFYVMGGLSSIWLILWIIFIQDSPNKQPLIDQQERDYINSSLGSGDSAHSTPKVIPWKSIFTSGPFYGILIAHCCNNFGWYMLLIELPIYMNGVLKFAIKENAIFTATPFLTLWFFSIFISKTLDSLRARGAITTTVARKIATLVASVVPMFALFALCFVGCRKMLAVAISGIAVTSIGAMFSGFLSNHIDIAPNFAGILMAITNTAATLPGISVPIFVGALTHSDPTIGSWRIIFGVTIFLYIIEIIAYLLLGSGEEQSWNKSEDEKSGPENTPLREQKQSDYNTKNDA